ncbi:MAG TPA: hypothetical protein VH062_17550 [Polyangiaceae bacterium]|nr:hypothetical protein [Polyangiaceae bacterium]
MYEEAERVCDFHRANAGEFLLPRSLAEVRHLVEQESLHIAVAGDDERIVALCYVKQEERDAEFGGIFVHDDVRQLCLADAMGKVAISTHLLTTPLESGTRLIAHVHEANDRPRNLLGRLGFKDTGVKDPLPSHIAPASMRKNAEGRVVGDVFEFDFAKCSDFADWLETRPTLVTGPRGSAALHIRSSALETFGPDAFTALRGIARGYRA